MAGADRRSGFEGRFSNLSEGQRYALALVLNLTFVGLVIGAFALLYASGFKTRRGDQAMIEPASASSTPTPAADAEPSGPARLDTVAEAQSEAQSGTGSGAQAERVESERVESERVDQATLLQVLEDLDGPTAAETEATSDSETDSGAFETVMLETEAAPSPAIEPSRLGAEQVETAPDTGADADAPLVEGADAGVESASGELEDQAGDQAGEPDAETALETAALDTATDAAGAAEEAATLGAASAAAGIATPGGAASAPTPRTRPDPTASLWVTAGEMASGLQSDFPCSRFSVQPGASGRPTLHARVGASDDIAEVRARAESGFGENADVAAGLGCSSVVGGGYVALSDERGQVVLFDEGGLSGEVRAALPREETCSLIGGVLATQPTLIQRLSVDGRQPASWVRANGEPALCEQDFAGSWSVLTGFDVAGRRAAALVVGDDIIAVEARRDADIGGAPAIAEAALPAALAALGQGGAPPAPSPVAADGEVAPISGPAPALPPGVPGSPEGYSVTVAFRVDPSGAPQELSVVGAGLAPVSVVAEALDVVAQSRFPARAEAYPAQHTVRFASSEFMNMLSRLSLTSATTGRAGKPVWDRAPSQADYDRVYPSRALDRSIEGEAAIGCLIDFDGRLDCSVISEEPRGWGFGVAALELAGDMRAAPRLSDGAPSANEQVELEFVFTPQQ